MNSRYTRALTPREQEVIELLSTGLTNEEIARQLDISLDGVKYHVSGILRRLRVENRREAASLHLGTEGGVLTPRELEVIELLSTGLTNEEIARQLGISLDGVKYHVSGILRRLDVGSRREAASLHLRTEGSGRFAALAPVIFLRKLPFALLPKAAAGAVLTATAAGIALLAWGVLSTSSDAGTTTGCEGAQPADGAAHCTRPVAQAGAGAGAISAISAGLFHSCALKDGGVWCWGGYFDSDGVSPGTGPVAVPGLASGVSAISSGIHSCALQHGGVWCWGAYPDAVRGQIEAGAPVAVLGLASGVTAISTSGDTSCALKDDGVWCWEQILYGGPATGARFSPPIAVAGLASGVSAISAGGDHSCALKDGGVWCWEQSQDSDVGGGSGVRFSPPMEVPGLASGVSAISAGGAIPAGSGHTCALKAGGVWCWGANSNGQLGNNSTTDSPVPVAVSGLTSGVTAISAGEDRTCAVKAGGAWCWGQLGAGNNSTTDSLVPVAVSGLASGVSAISGTCALKDDGAWCWGDNSSGQLGNARWSDVPVPVSGLASGVSALISGDGGASAISAGGAHRCALKEGGVWCWGWNDEGQLGNNSTTDSPVPVAVPGLGSGVSAISAGPCALKDDVLWCWGHNYFGGESHVPVAVPGLVTGVAINETCALKDGGVWCLGGAPEGPVAVPGFEGGVSAISAGPLCALKDGGVWCARLDNGLPLVAVPGLERGVSALSGSCALQDGGVSCWSWSEDNGLPGLADRPVGVPGLESGVSAISVDRSADFRICALKDGGVWCSPGSTAGAVAMPGLESGVSAISGNCALKEGGVWCWGSNSHGQLGNNSPVDSVPVAVQFPP